jgi:hypothetical protein
MAYSGWLIKFGNVILPNSFLLADGWTSTPNQRLEADAFRAANALLHRETLENFKTSMRLTIRGMNLEERRAFDSVIGLATLPNDERKQRKLRVTYWNDEELEYKTGNFYMTDPEYTIHTTDDIKMNIEYNSFELEFVEY